MFGRKKKNAVPAEAENAGNGSPDKGGSKVKQQEGSAGKKESRKKKKNELLRIFDESVWESVFQDLCANKNFIVKNPDGSSRYIALLFDTNSIGGLTGKDAKKDESKGSIIEAIRTGRIKTFIRNEMLMDDLFIIIPDADTIENMDEFVVLTGVDFVLCSISAEGNIVTETQGGLDEPDDPEIVVSYSSIADIVNNGKSVTELLPYYGNSGSDPDSSGSGGGDDYSEVSFPEEDNDSIEDLPDDLDDDSLDEDADLDAYVNPSHMDDSDDDVPTGDIDDLDDYYDNVAPDDTGSDLASGVSASPASDGFANYGDDADDDAGATAGDDGGYDEFEDVTSQDVREYVTRQFYSNDLGLEVSSLPFDVEFMNGNPYILFQEDRGSGWLNEYLANMAKDANTRMSRLHEENLFKLRGTYLRMIQKHCESIAKALDISDDTTQYGRMRFAIEHVRAENLSNVQSIVASKRDQLDSRWDATLEQVGLEAAASARRQYIDQYGRSHDNDIMLLETHAKDEIERDYQNALRDMNKDRRMEASKLLDVAINETLSDLSEKYLKILGDEKKEYIRLQNSMTKFIDDNRKDEKARIEVLNEENKNKNKADEVRRDAAAKMQVMQAEFDEKKSMLQADIERMRREHEMYIENSKSEFASRIDDERARSSQLQQQVDELLEKYRILDEANNAKYEKRIKELEGLAASKDDDIDRIMSSNKRVSFMAIVGVVTAVIAAIGIGFMFGSFVNVRTISQAERQGIYKQAPVDYSTNDTSVSGTDMLPEK